MVASASTVKATWSAKKLFTLWHFTENVCRTLLYQFSSVAPLCPTLCDPMDCSTPGFPVHHQPPELAQTYVHQVSDAINHFILCRPLLLLPSIFPSIRVFSNDHDINGSLVTILDQPTLLLHPSFLLSEENLNLYPSKTLTYPSKFRTNNPLHKFALG